MSRRLNLEQSAPKCNLYLSCELAKLGHEIHVLTSMTAPQAYQKLRKAGTIIQKTPFFGKKLSPFLYTQFAQRLKNRFSADIVLGNGYTLFDDVTWVHFLRLVPIARLGSEHWSLYAEAVLEKLLLSTSGLLLVPSSLVAEDLRKIYGTPSNKIIVQPHGVDTEYYVPLTKMEKSRLRTQGKICLLFVGDPLRKGFHLLLKGLASVRDCKNLRLVAVGFNPGLNLRLLVEKLGLKRIVSFEGFVKTTRLRELYQSSDLFVLPSLYDPFSIATLEAMATGLPAVISYNTGIRDILRNWDNTIVVDPLDIAQFARVLTVLAHDDKLRRKIGINARITAERFSWENVAKNTAKVFEETIRR